MDKEIKMIIFVETKLKSMDSIKICGVKVDCYGGWYCISDLNTVIRKAENYGVKFQKISATLEGVSFRKMLHAVLSEKIEIPSYEEFNYNLSEGEIKYFKKLKIYKSSGARENRKAYCVKELFDLFVLYLHPAACVNVFSNYESDICLTSIKEQYGSNDSVKTYIMYDSATGYYKIGKSKKPQAREKTLQSQKPTIEIVTILDVLVEKELHEKYKSKRIRGEWFSLDENDLIAIKSYANELYVAQTKKKRK